MESFLVSAGVVAVAEIGDKTQLLALLLASRFRAPFSISLGILLATLANHAGAAALGVWTAAFVPHAPLLWLAALSFFAMAFWALRKDSLDRMPEFAASAGAFLAALVSFFIVEIGDKTQVATVALASRYHSVFAVTSGTTLGMMIANVPVVMAGQWAARRLPLGWIRVAAAAMFLLLGFAAAVDAARFSGAF